MQTARLVTLKKSIGQPLLRAFPKAIIIDTDLAEIEENLFVTLSDDEEDESPTEGPRVHAVLWATSRGAAMRASNSNIRADDGQTAFPPDYMLPPDAKTYGAIVHHLKSSGAPCLESASYRIMVDGAFIHKSIQTKGAIYYFRSQSITKDETPYAVLRTNV